VEKASGPDLEFELVGKKTLVLPPFKEQVRQLLSAIPNPAFNALHSLLTLSPKMFMEFLAGWIETSDSERFKKYHHFHKCFANAIKDLDAVVALPQQEASLLRIYLSQFSNTDFAKELQVELFFLSLSLGTFEFVSQGDTTTLAGVIQICAVVEEAIA
jgi:hypothetical protein